MLRQIAIESTRDEHVRLNEIVKERKELQNHECYAPVVDKIIERCFNLNNEYVLRNLYMMVNLCERGIAQEQIFRAIGKVCPVKFSD